MKTFHFYLFVTFHLSLDPIITVNAGWSTQYLDTGHWPHPVIRPPEGDILPNRWASGDAVFCTPGAVESNRFNHLDRASEGSIASSNQNVTPCVATPTHDHHHYVVIMEDDGATIEAAVSLFERHPGLATLLTYREGALRVLTGAISRPHATRHRHVSLVGHGSVGADGTGKLGGYVPEELAAAVSAINTKYGHLDSVRLIGCDLGKEVGFTTRLLQTLRSFDVRTRLHLYSSTISVRRSDGEILTKDHCDGVWRYDDGCGRVTAELGRRGDLVTTAGPCRGGRGQSVPGYRGKTLYYNKLEWPTHPQMFVPADLRKKYLSMDCLEGLTWSLFFEQSQHRRAPDYVPEDHQKRPVWLSEPQGSDVTFKHLANIQDILVEIRYNAREESDSDLYYVLNDGIYKVQKKTFSVSLAGKLMSPDDDDAVVEHFLDDLQDQKNMTSLAELRRGLKASKFNDFCRQTFQLRQCAYNCERWGHYFMASVFAASVRNFRTFALFLMSVIACEVGRSRGVDSSVCSAFVGNDHPMILAEGVGGDAWPQQRDDRRGFYGGTVDSAEEVQSDKVAWLDQIVAKEDALYAKSKRMMGGVDHDLQTELDIFGRVKVMNKYSFSSYLEYFRGTVEGKRLKRGCTFIPGQPYN